MQCIHQISKLIIKKAQRQYGGIAKQVQNFLNQENSITLTQ